MEILPVNRKFLDILRGSPCTNAAVYDILTAREIRKTASLCLYERRDCHEVHLHLQESPSQ